MANIRQRSNIKTSFEEGRKKSIFQSVRTAVQDVILNRATRSVNVERIEQMSVWPYVVMFVVFFVFSIYLIDYIHYLESGE